LCERVIGIYHLDCYIWDALKPLGVYGVLMQRRMARLDLQFITG